MAMKSLLEEFVQIEKYIDKKHKNDKDLKKLISQYKCRLTSFTQEESGQNAAKKDDCTNNQTTVVIPNGLINEKSVCYMNALIQALASSKITIKKFLELSKRFPDNSSLNLLVVLLDNVNENKDSIRSNSELLKRLVDYMKWTKPSQQDAFDLLATFIEHIEKDFENKNKDHDLPLKIKILHEFKDKGTPNAIQTYLGLSLNLCGEYEKKSGVHLGYMIDQHFNYSMIDNNPNKLTRMSLYEKAPDVLLIHIQANKLNPTTSKLYKPTYFIKYEEDMTIYFHIVKSKEGGDQTNDDRKDGDRDLKTDRPYNTAVKYNLKALVEHLGEISCGHFRTYRKWNDNWYLMNDERATPTKFKTETCPYLMIYERTFDQKECDQTNDDRKDGDQTNDDRKDRDQKDSDRKDGDPTNDDRKDGDQTNNDPTNDDRKDGDQKDSDRKDGDQTNNDRKDRDRKDGDQTNNDRKDRDRKDGDQTNDDRKDRDQTDNDRKDGDQKDSDRKDGDQTNDDRKDRDRKDSDRKDGDQTNNDRKDRDQKDGDQTNDDRKDGGRTD